MAEPLGQSQPQRLTAMLEELGVRINRTAADIHRLAGQLVGGPDSKPPTPSTQGASTSPLRTSTSDVIGWLGDEVAALEEAIKRLV